MYLWGPSKSYVRNPWYKHPQFPQYGEEPEYFDDGMLAFARTFREMNRWHSESQSFVGTRWGAAEGDGYDVVATELNWATGAREGQWSDNLALRDTVFPWRSDELWVAYHDRLNNVKISYFQAVHDRNGSISYKLEWNGLSMIFSGDTRPNMFMVNALTGSKMPVDLLIHETVLPPEVWAAAANGGQAGQAAITTAHAVQENSHTPEKGLGWILNQAQRAGKAPRLALATHFQASDDTIRPALDAVRSWYQGPFSIVTDLVVINVSSKRILQRRAVVSDYSPTPPTVDARFSSGTVVPKYNDPRTTSPYYPYSYGPLEQLSPFLQEQVIQPCLYDPTSFSCQNPYAAYNPPPNPPGVTSMLRRR
jgi:ribonuclease Z